MGVLTQTMGTWDRPVAYFLKRLDNVATRWPGCLWTVAAVPLPIQEATELTLGQDLIIKVPHVVNTLPLRGPHKWLSTSQITQYQRLLRENPCVTIEPCQALNPVTFLPVGECGPSRLQGYPRSFCQQTWLERPANLRPRLDPEHRWHQPAETRKRLSGYAVVMEETIVKVSFLPSHWSTQWTELYALICALQLSKGEKTNIYVDSKYAFDTFMIIGLYIKREIF